MLITGLVIGGRLALQVTRQQNTDSAQDKAWQQFVVAAQGQAPSPGPSAAAAALPGSVYLKLTVPKLSNKDGVAVDGDWGSLTTASMVHYKDSPAPGAKGNVLVAFHRETHWMDINQLAAGDQVQIQTTDLKVHVYQIDLVRTVHPTDVSLLRPTEGNDLTLITCDPPWQDYNRMLFRGHLVPS
ncbi:MAG: sortase [Chloroflexota bacterium]|nr:sortase [Chloroflexota bacterium]